MLLRRHNQRVNVTNTNKVEQKTKQVETPVSSVSYTKTDISRMSKSELVTLATENGIANADGISGSELKVMLIEKLV